MVPAAANRKDGLPEFDINTLAGVMTVRLISQTPDTDGNGETAQGQLQTQAQAQNRWPEYGATVEVNMGYPDFTPALSHIDTDKENFLRVNHKVDFGGGEKNIILSAFFMGTIHTVVWLEENGMADYSIDEKEAFGKMLSEDPVFMEKTNVNMARIIDKDNVELITFERGAGLTSACGTGACATAVLGHREGKLSNNVRIHLPLGALQIRIADEGAVFMTGPAVHVFNGQIDIQGNIV
jgi:diaminopimelate epimerase